MGAKDEMRAMAETDALLALKPDWAPAVIMKAQLLARTPEKSLEILDDYIKRQASPAEVNPDVRLVRARLLVELRRFPEARADFAGLLAERPDNPDIIYAMGLLSMQLGDGEAAEKHLRRLFIPGLRRGEQRPLLPGATAEETGRTGKPWKFTIRSRTRARAMPPPRPAARPCRRTAGIWRAHSFAWKRLRPPIRKCAPCCSWPRPSFWPKPGAIRRASTCSARR